MRRPTSGLRRKLHAAQQLEPRLPLDGDTTGAISGTIWFDQNQDGLRDLEEPALPDVIVYLDENGNGVRDEHELFVLTHSDDPLTLDTNEAGTFHFENLPDGDYTLAVDLPDHAHWVSPSPDMIVEDVIENGSFEESSEDERFLGWQYATNPNGHQWQRVEGGQMEIPFANIEPTSPQDGDWNAAHKFSADLAPSTYTLQQQVSLGQGEEAKLRFKSRIQWNHQLDLFPNGVFEEPHSFNVIILDPDSGNTLDEFHLFETDITPGNRQGDTGWLNYSIDLSEFLNQEVVVQFFCNAPTVGPAAGSALFELDAVELLVRSSAPAPLGQQVSIAGGGSVGEIDFGIHSTLGYNSPPSIDAPETALLDEDAPLVFDAANDLGIQLQAVPGSVNLPRLQLSVDVGTLQLGSLDGIVLVEGTGEGDSHLVIEGTLESLQLAIDGLRFHPPENYHGSATISIDLNDQNDEAFQGRQTVSHTISLEVTPVNDPPFVAVEIDPIHVSRGTESVSLDLSQLFNDVDILTSGDQLALSITQNSHAEFVTSQLDVDQLQLHLDPQFYGTAEIEITATDLEGELATFVLHVSVREKFDLEMTLVDLESADQPGSVVTEIPRSPLRFHEWEPVTIQFWITPSNWDSQETLQVSVDLDFDPLLWTPGDIVAVEGATIETMIHTDENGNWLELTIDQVELPTIEASDSILLTALTWVPTPDSSAGVSMSDLTAHPAASSEVGISLREARLGETASPLTATTSEGAELLPVIYDLDDDGRIGLSDFTRFISSYGQTSTPENAAALAADFSQSGSVGLSDFLLFIQNYGRRKENHPAIIFPEILQLDSSSEPEHEEPDGGEILEGEPIIEPEPAAHTSDPWQTWWFDSATSEGARQIAVEGATRAENWQSLEVEPVEQSTKNTAQVDQLWAYLASQTETPWTESLADEAATAWSSELPLPSEFCEEETDHDRR